VPIKFRCPECSEPLEYGDDAAGTRVRCLACREQVTVSGDDGELLHERQRPASARGQFSAGEVLGAFLLIIGLCLLVIGALITGFYWLEYDTTVTGIGVSDRRVYNAGRINDRLVGTLVGIGTGVIGAVFLSAGAVVSVIGAVSGPVGPRPTRRQ
jgi:hypothetical protein